MIVDRLENAKMYYDLVPGLETGFEWLKTADLENIEVGRYELDGDKVVALIQEYDTMENPPWETHNDHLDIQFLIKGEELIGYYPNITHMVKKQEYNAVDDYDLYEDVEGADYVTLKDDVIMILMPQDGHLPRKLSGSSMPVKKCVIKVKMK